MSESKEVELLKKVLEMFNNDKYTCKDSGSSWPINAKYLLGKIKDYLKESSQQKKGAKEQLIELEETHRQLTKETTKNEKSQYHLDVADGYRIATGLFEGEQSPAEGHDKNWKKIYEEEFRRHNELWKRHCELFFKHIELKMRDTTTVPDTKDKAKRIDVPLSHGELDYIRDGPCILRNNIFIYHNEEHDSECIKAKKDCEYRNESERPGNDNPVEFWKCRLWNKNKDGCTYCPHNVRYINESDSVYCDVSGKPEGEDRPESAEPGNDEHAEYMMKERMKIIEWKIFWYCKLWNQNGNGCTKCPHKLGESIDGDLVYCEVAGKPDSMGKKVDVALLVRGNVLKNKATGRKFVYSGGPNVRENPDDYAFICDQPHEDGDYSYICAFNSCRCMATSN